MTELRHNFDEDLNRPSSREHYSAVSFPKFNLLKLCRDLNLILTKVHRRGSHVEVRPCRYRRRGDHRLLNIVCATEWPRRGWSASLAAERRGHRRLYRRAR